MRDYIDRDSAIAALEKALFEYEDETEQSFIDDPELDVAEWFFHRIFVQVMNGKDRQAVLDLPAADVRPAVRGKWIKYYPQNSDMLTCSECERYWILDGEQYDFHFCPNCGCAMGES